MTQPSVNVQIAYAAESTFGTAPAAGTSQLLRRVSSTLALSKNAIASNEVRSDQQVFDVRHGTKTAGGSIDGELSTVSYDDLIQAVLRGTWQAGVTSNQAALTTVSADSSASTITFTGGDPLSIGFKLGDVIRFTGMTQAANNAKNFRITAFGGTSNRTLTVTPAPTTSASSSTFTVAVQGRKLVNGTAQRSFTIEQRYPDISTSERFTGMRVGAMNVSMQPGAMASVRFDFQGLDGSLFSAGSYPYFTSPTAEAATGVMAGVSGSLRLAGAEQAIVTAADFSVNCNLRADPVIGSFTVPQIFYGRSVVTGSVSAFLKDAALINAFLVESETDLVVQLNGAGADPQDFLTFNFQRIKLNGASKTVGPDGGVIATFPFQALLRTGGAGTAYDQSTMVVQRSNV